MKYQTEIIIHFPVMTNADSIVIKYNYIYNYIIFVV